MKIKKKQNKIEYKLVKNYNKFSVKKKNKPITENTFDISGKN